MTPSAKVRRRCVAAAACLPLPCLACCAPLPSDARSLRRRPAQQSARAWGPAARRRRKAALALTSRGLTTKITRWKVRQGAARVFESCLQKRIEATFCSFFTSLRPQSKQPCKRPCLTPAPLPPAGSAEGEGEESQGEEDVYALLNRAASHAFARKVRRLQAGAAGAGRLSASSLPTAAAACVHAPELHHAARLHALPLARPPALPARARWATTAACPNRSAPLHMLGMHRRSSSFRCCATGYRR